MFGVKDEYLDNLKNKLDKLFDDFLHKPTVLPSKIEILEDHILKTNGGKLEMVPIKPFEADADYFQIKVNQLYLACQSRLWVTTDPTVLVNTQFGYDGKKDVSVPSLVGPSAMKMPQGQIPKGGKMIIENKTVAGYYPFKGGELECSVVLCQLNTEDVAKKIMKLVESIASAVDYSTQLSSYLKVAGVVIDGIEELVGIKEGLTPLVGYSAPFTKPGCIALINKDKVGRDELWVIDDKLKKGKSAVEAAKDDASFIDGDYALYTIYKTTTRDDVKYLPFYPAFEKILADACKKDEASWERAKTDMSTLFITMFNSPDLTEKQAQEQYSIWTEKMTKVHEMTKPKGKGIRQPVVDLTPEEKKILQKSLSAKLTSGDKKMLKESFKVLSLP